MNENIAKIRKLVKERFEEKDWKYHIVPVLKYAKKLAKVYKVDEELVELAALLHDIGRVKMENDEVHHIIGIPEAEKILKKFNYPEKIIKEVKHVIESHRLDQGPKPKTLVAKIIANADAMAHFDILPVFFWWRKSRKEYSFEDTLQWVENKLKNDWKKKITLPKAKKMVEKKYKAIRLILDSLKNYASEK